MTGAVRRGGRSTRAGIALAALVVLLAGGAVAAPVASPPSPVDILGRRDLDAPPLDAVPMCVPEVLEGLVDPVVEKAAEGR